MSKLSIEEVKAKLEALEVEYSDKATYKQLLTLLKESEEEAGEEVEEDEDTDEDDQETDEKDSEEETASVDKSSDSAHSVTFKIRNPNTREKHSERTFSKAVHGKDFMALADSFEASNTHKKPVDTNPLTNKEEVEAVIAHNRTIKHPILSKHVE